MGAPWNGIAVVILTTWFAASVVQQFQISWWKSIERWDVLGLLPRWRFFAPSPSRHDLHLVVRDVTDAGCSEWSEVTFRSSSVWFRWIWNPEKYLRKALFDTVLSLRRAGNHGPNAPRTIMLSAPYIRLLHWAMKPELSLLGATGRQFAVVATQSNGPQHRVEIRFLSETHPLHG